MSFVPATRFVPPYLFRRFVPPYLNINKKNSQIRKSGDILRSIRVLEAYDKITRLDLADTYSLFKMRKNAIERQALFLSAVKVMMVYFHS